MTLARIAHTLVLAFIGALSLDPRVASAEILKLAELTTEQVRALNREKTIVIIPGGILEEHGPFLPSFTDGYRNEATAEELARLVVARPGWTALMLPTIPLGVGGANELGGHFSFPGTYAVRSTTLRAVFVDLASELAEQGFKWIFVVHLHGAPGQHRALDEAGDFFRDTYGGRMVHLYGLMPVITAGAPSLKPADAAENGLDMHAGRAETSDILFIRPDLVAPGYKTAPSLPGKNWDELIRIARAPGWPGYFGAPKQASAAEGHARIQQRSRVAAELMWRIVTEGADDRAIPRWSAMMADSEAIARVDRAEAAHERAREERFATWLAQRKKR
ncbi:MAG TPA: creatininase family protein [Vicinamibacterales bacterium]|nr:creatininase family protein [Vicinamibacterales bacterium]